MGELSKRGRAWLLGLGAITSLGLVAGCSPATHSTSAAHPKATPTSKVTSAQGVQTEALPLPGFTSLVQAGNRTGSAQLALLSHVAPGTMGVQIQCTGTGAVHVEVTTIIAFDVNCGNAASFNEIHLGTSRANVVVSVTSNTSAHWALSLGWKAGGSKPSSSDGLS